MILDALISGLTCISSLQVLIFVMTTAMLVQMLGISKIELEAFASTLLCALLNAKPF